MVWREDEYFYSVGVLKAIASWYDIISEVLMIGDYQITNKLGIALYKADFDMALNEIGRGKWDGRIDNKDFRDFKYFGRLQQIILADLYEITDGELEARGFYDIPRLRGIAYSRMVESLNNKGGKSIAKYR